MYELAGFAFKDTCGSVEGTEETWLTLPGGSDTGLVVLVPTTLHASRAADRPEHRVKDQPDGR